MGNAKSKKFCKICGPLVFSTFMVCEHAEPLAEGLLHRAGEPVARELRSARPPRYTPPAKEHSPESARGYVKLSLTYEVVMATTSSDISALSPTLVNQWQAASGGKGTFELA